MRIHSSFAGYPADPLKKVLMNLHLQLLREKGHQPSNWQDRLPDWDFLLDVLPNISRAG